LGDQRRVSIGRAGELRDIRVYSMIRSQWPAVRENLSRRLSGKDVR
jgi:hypothetical protein